MLKILSSFLRFTAASVLILQFFTNVDAQADDIRIKIKAETQLLAEIEYRFSAHDQQKNWVGIRFLDEYAGINGLIEERFSLVKIYDKTGYLVAQKRFMAADTVRVANMGAIGYTVGLKPRSSPFAAAHVSWMNGDGGLLMLGDLFPQSTRKTAKIRFEMPDGWKVFSSETEIEPDVFMVSDIDKAVFYLGLNMREYKITARNSHLYLTISGDWHFSDAAAASISESIFEHYDRLFGSLPKTSLRIRIDKFPVPVAIGNWEADTRGRSVTIMSSDMPFKSQSLQRLHEQLRHELFHLWIPNGLNLSGKYDWFYEGFALYQSLKTGVAVNRIGFNDFLNTLSRAYEIDRLQTKKLSLIDASKERWNGADTQIYARGLLVAFLCDLALLERSKGKRSVANILKEIYEKHRFPAPIADGNTALLNILRINSELVPIVDRNITGAESLVWESFLKFAGITAETNDKLTKLRVSPKPTSGQKAILDMLGYNNWRKLASSDK